MKIYSPLQVAKTILDGFATHVHQFIKITMDARSRFEEQAWWDLQKAAQEPIDRHEGAVQAVYRTLSERIGYENLSHGVWAETCRNYVVLM